MEQNEKISTFPSKPLRVGYMYKYTDLKRERLGEVRICDPARFFRIGCESDSLIVQMIPRR